MTLSDKEINYIFNELKILGISDHLLQDELCDHICCSIEAKLRDNISFKEAFQMTMLSFGEKGLIGVQKQTKFQLFEKYRPFRNLLISSFIILLTGFFLKLFHLPGAGISYLIATSIYLIGIFRLSYLIMKEKSFPKYRMYFGLILVAYIVIWLMAQKSGGNIYPVTYLVIPVIFFFGLLCSLHFFSKLKTTENSKTKAKYLVFITLCLMPVLLCLTDILVLLRIIQIDLTNFLFWIIIIVFMLSSIYILFIKYFKNIAVLTLLLSVTLFYLPLSIPALLSKVHISNKQTDITYFKYLSDERNIKDIMSLCDKGHVKDINS